MRTIISLALQVVELPKIKKDDDNDANTHTHNGKTMTKQRNTT